VFDAVFTRRADHLNSERMRELDRYEAECDGRYELESAIAAYLRPVFGLIRQGGHGWRNFCAFVGNASSAPELTELLAQKFDPVVKRFIAILRKAVPDADEADLFWSYHMFLGSVTFATMDTGAIERASGGLCRLDDLVEIEPRLVKYGAEGFRAVCSGRGTSRRIKK
jgi:hypothetical protein